MTTHVQEEQALASTAPALLPVSEWTRSHVAPLAVLVPLVALITVTYAPGHMSADTLTQIEQVRVGTYTDYHAPILLSLWRAAWLVVPATWYVLLATVAVFVASTYVLLRVALPRLGAALVTTSITLSPLALGYLGVLSRDTWFMTLTLAAFSALLRSREATGRRQVTLLVVGLLLSWLATGARQNGFPVALAAGLVAAGILLDRRQISSSRRRHVVRLGVAFGVMIAIAASQLLYVRFVLSARPAQPEQAVFVYDLIGISLREGAVVLPPDIYPASDLSLLRGRTSTASIDGALFVHPVLIPFPLREELLPELRRSWLRAIREHPRSYLDTRWDLWLEQIAWKSDVLWIHHPHIDPNPWRYRPTFPSLEQRANEYVTWFAAGPGLQGGPLFEIWVYLLVHVAGLLYVRSADARRRLVALLSATALLYELTFFFGAMGTQYRFSLPAVVTALIVASLGVTDLAHLAARRHRSRRERLHAIASASGELPREAALPQRAR